MRKDENGMLPIILVLALIAIVVLLVMGVGLLLAFALAPKTMLAVALGLVGLLMLFRPAALMASVGRMGAVLIPFGCIGICLLILTGVL